MLATLILLTLASICFSLWVRHETWKSTQERAATLNILLQGCAVLLMSPMASETIGIWLHDVTGIYNLEDYIGHDCYIVAASAIVLNALGRTDEGNELQKSFRLYVELPATFCIPLLLTAFSMGAGATNYHSDFFQVRTDIWLTAYWFLLCSTLIYLLMYGARLLSILRNDPRSKWLANAYIAMCGSGIAACLVRMVMSTRDSFQTPTVSGIVWILACICGAGFALAAAWSWQQKAAYFTTRRAAAYPDPLQPYAQIQDSPSDTHESSECEHAREFPE